MPLSPVIQIAIPDSNGERCRDQIAAILQAELDYQYTSHYNELAQVDAVQTERSNPIDFTEVSLINVSLGSEVYSGKSYAGNRFGNVSINVDVYVKSATTSDARGDSQARKKCTKLLSLCSYILDDPQYKTLGFGPGFISTTAVENIELAEAEKYDSQNLMQGRLSYSVTVSESNALLDGIPLNSAITQSLIGLTGKGMKYITGADGPNPPLNPNFVYVRDKKTGGILQLVPGGQYYDVNVLKKLIDAIIANETTIIDNIIS